MEEVAIYVLENAYKPHSHSVIVLDLSGKCYKS